MHSGAGNRRDNFRRAWTSAGYEQASQIVPDRDADLSIARLAAMVGMPEKKLRALINERLGHKNFASYVNAFRLEEVRQRLANLRLVEAVARKVGLPMERVIVTVREHGNTSAASIPLALDCAIQDGRVRPGQLLLLEAFGGGFTWGSALLRL